jgi:hypothetical protein
MPDSDTRSGVAEGVSRRWARWMLQSHTAMLRPEVEDAAHRALLRGRRFRSERCASRTCTRSESFGQSVPSPRWVMGQVDGRPPRVEYEMFLGTLSKELTSRAPPRPTRRDGVASQPAKASVPSGEDLSPWLRPD